MYSLFIIVFCNFLLFLWRRSLDNLYDFEYTCIIFMINICFVSASLSQLWREKLWQYHSIKVKMVSTFNYRGFCSYSFFFKCMFSLYWIYANPGLKAQGIILIIFSKMRSGHDVYKPQIYRYKGMYLKPSCPNCFCCDPSMKLNMHFDEFTLDAAAFNVDGTGKSEKKLLVHQY